MKRITFAAALLACAAIPVYAQGTAPAPAAPAAPAAAASSAAPAASGTAASSTNSQQQKMKDCNAQAKTQNLSGTARKSFMKTCLSGGAADAAAGASSAASSTTAAASSAKTSQQQKMKDCNAQAKTQNLTGADRKTFMKTCLSNQPAS
jgi:hypothetical protein